MSPRYQRRFTVTVRLCQSTSDHLKAIASPTRNPVTASSLTKRPLFASRDATSDWNWSAEGITLAFFSVFFGNVIPLAVLWSSACHSTAAPSTEESTVRMPRRVHHDKLDL